MQSLTQYREVGHGHCGSVWTNEQEDETLVIKREDGGPGRSIAKDAEMHQAIQSSLSSAKIPYLNIPAYHQLVDARDDEFWTRRLPQFPPKYQACAALISERIQPIPKLIRERLIDKYCSAEARTKIKCNRPDEDCLIRPYLGRRLYNSRPSRFFTLRNRPLHCDQMEEIGLPVKAYAQTMADALAVIYWSANIDANDVELVLAPAGTHPGSNTWPSQMLGDHTMWLLDFDCCNNMSMDQSGIKQAAEAFYKNDYFYPRPASDNQADAALWEAFTTRFLESSRSILGHDSLLPRMMVDRLEQVGRQKKEEKIKAAQS